MNKQLAKGQIPNKRIYSRQQDNNKPSGSKELDLLESYLKGHGHKYTRQPLFDIMPGAGEQIIAFDDDGNRIWDAVCGHGTYEGNHGLLEVMGCIINVPDDVQGWLTAAEVIGMIERQR